MPHTMHKIARRSLLAAGGTLLAAVAARKYLDRKDTGSLARAGEAAPPPDAGPALQPPGAIQARPPAALPALHFTTADGTPRTVADYAGKGLVLNFWATWCVPCVSEMPALDGLSRALAARGIAVLPVSLDRGGADAVRPFYAGHGIRDLPVLLDPHAGTMMALRLDGIPTTLLVDRHGREVARMQGPVRWDAPDAADVIARIVG